MPIIFTHSHKQNITNTKHTKHNSQKPYRKSILLEKSTIEMNKYKPQIHNPTGYISVPCITKCDFTL